MNLESLALIILGVVLVLWGVVKAILKPRRTSPAPPPPLDLAPVKEVLTNALEEDLKEAENENRKPDGPIDVHRLSSDVQSSLDRIRGRNP